MKKKNSIVSTIKGMLLITMITCCITNISGIVFAGQADSQIEQNIANADMDVYIRKTRNSVKNNWYPPVSAFENSATLVLKVNREGELLDCYIAEPSSSKEFDESLINAAKKTKYLPLPENVSGKSANIPLEFSMQRRHISK